MEVICDLIELQEDGTLAIELHSDEGSDSKTHIRTTAKIGAHSYTVGQKYDFDIRFQTLAEKAPAPTYNYDTMNINYRVKGVGLADCLDKLDAEIQRLAREGHPPIVSSLIANVMASGDCSTIDMLYRRS